MCRAPPIRVLVDFDVGRRRGSGSPPTRRIRCSLDPRGAPGYNRAVRRRFGVDRFRALAYIAAFLVAGAVAAPARAAEYQTYLGATLPKWARKIGEHRFQSPWDWHTTIRWLNKTYTSRAEYPRIRIVNQPGVKAIHLKNARKRGGWEGMNVYQLADGRVRFYVLPKEKPKEPRAKAPSR